MQELGVTAAKRVSAVGYVVDEIRTSINSGQLKSGRSEEQHV